MKKIQRELPNGEFFKIVQEQLARGQPVIFTVKGVSMQPFLRDGKDQVQVEICKMPLKVGDILLFQCNESPTVYLLHRVVRLIPGGCQTKGDGNRFQDSSILEEQIIGKVTKVYRGGKGIDCQSIRWRLASRLWLRRTALQGIIQKRIIKNTQRFTRKRNE